MSTSWIIILALLLSGCGILSNGLGNANTRSFVATPVADEIRLVTYSIETSAGTDSWILKNDDLRIRKASKPRNGIARTVRSKKMTPNEYNWVVYNLEQANFTKVKSVSGSGSPYTHEVLTVVTQSNSYTYTQNSATRFPKGFQKVVSVIPGLSNPRK